MFVPGWTWTDGKLLKVSFRPAATLPALATWETGHMENWQPGPKLVYDFSFYNQIQYNCSFFLPYFRLVCIAFNLTW